MFENTVLATGYQIATIVGVIIALISVFVVYKSYKGTQIQKKKEKALELAKYYAEVIIPESVFISKLLKNIDINKTYSIAVEKAKLKDFTLEELKSIFKNDYNGIEKMWKEIKFIDIIKTKIECCDSNVDLVKLLEINEKYQNEKYSRNYISILGFIKIIEKDSHSAVHEKTVLQEYKSYQRNLANKLEWFAMNFKEGIADDEVVYQSLHQTYFQIVKCLYFLISSFNDENSKCDKYFTNIIWLYLKWQKNFLNKQLQEQTIK